MNNNLTSITIPESIDIIWNHAFENNNLTSINIPDSVTIIGERTFAGNNLTSVIIPDNVKNIWNGAFINNNITSVTILGTDLTPHNRAFHGAGSDLSIVYNREPGTFTRVSGTNANWKRVS